MEKEEQNEIEAIKANALETQEAFNEIVRILNGELVQTPKTNTAERVSRLFNELKKERARNFTLNREKSVASNEPIVAEIYRSRLLFLRNVIDRALTEGDETSTRGYHSVLPEKLFRDGPLAP